MAGLTKHACPSVHLPMAEADGLLARVRVPGGRLTVDQWAGLGLAAAAHGSGVIELTSRANVQLRGIAAAHVDALVDDLVALDLVHPDRDVDQRRNVVGAPAAGWDPTEVVDVGPLIADITRRLIDDDRPAHPKSGVVVDGGGTVSLRGRRATVALAAARRRDTGAVVYEVATADAVPVDAPPSASTAVVDAGEAAALAVEALTSPSATAALERVDVTGLQRPTPDVAAPLGRYDQSGGRVFVGAAPVLGRLDPELVAAVAASVRRHRATEVRLTPWRGVLVGDLEDDGLVGDLAGLGLVVDRTDPASAVIACAGRTGCSSGTVDTIADGHIAVALLRRRPAGERPLAVHLSGCAKRCASHAAHDLTLVGADDGRGYDGYDLDEAEILRSVTLELALGATRA